MDIFWITASAVLGAEDTSQCHISDIVASVLKVWPY